MANLRYTGNTSLDGYTVDADGSFDFGPLRLDVLAYITDLERDVGTYLYGRRMFETMRVWEDLPLENESDLMRDFAAVWRAAEKVVYSRTLTSVTTAKTRLERDFDPSAVLELIANADRPVSIDGPTLAVEAFRAGLIDELHQFVHPIIVGGGTPYLPAGIRLNLELVDEHRFDSGVVYLRYKVKG
jgi:dihydrofolate reductase